MDKPRFTVTHNYDDPQLEQTFNSTGVEFPNLIYSDTSFELLHQAFKGTNNYDFTDFSTASLSIKPADSIIAPTVISTGAIEGVPTDGEVLFVVDKDVLSSSFAQFTTDSDPVPIVLYLIIESTNNEKISLETLIRIMDINREGNSEGTSFTAAGMSYSPEQSAKWTSQYWGTPTNSAEALDKLARVNRTDRGIIISELAVQPGAPSDGDAYIATATAGDWTDTYVQEFNSITGSWLNHIPREGDAVYNSTTSTKRLFNGSAWVDDLVIATAADVPNVPSGNLAATDVQAALDELQTDIDNLPDAMEYKGAWNASTNTPTLIDGTGDLGDFYRVSVAGSQDLGGGSVSYEVSDALVYSGTVWDHFEHTDTGLLAVVDDLTPQLGGDLDLNGNNLDFPTTPNISDCLDEDNMSSDSPTMLATQQSIKAYVDSQTNVGVYRDIYIDAAAMVPRDTNGAEALTKEFATNDIMIDYLAFDSTTEEGVQFKMMMPDEWDRSTIKLKFFWDAAVTASGTVIWGVKAGALSNDDAIDAALGTQITVTDTLLAVGDMHISPATAAVTVGGTPALEDMIIFQVVATTGGTIAVDQFLMGIAIQYKESTTTPVIW